MTTQEKQDTLNKNGLGHIKVLDNGQVTALVDGVETCFDREDAYAGMTGSGIASFGSVYGDWRMIAAIAEDIETAFGLIEEPAEVMPTT